MGKGERELQTRRLPAINEMLTNKKGHRRGFDRTVRKFNHFSLFFDR
jgi:hypothetical protein